MDVVKTKVCVVGAGAGGTGCVYRLIKSGIDTVVIDKNTDFGGTMVFSGIDGWEPGVSLDGMHMELKNVLEKMSEACHIIETVPNCNLFIPENKMNWSNHSFDERPWGLSMPTGKVYEDTMKRCSSLRGNDTLKRFQFDPDAMKYAINTVLFPYKQNLMTLFGYNFSECVKENGKIKAVVAENENKKIMIEAEYFVDATGDILLARRAGCNYTFGTEGKKKYNEPDATGESDNVNAVTYAFRIRSVKDKNNVDHIPDEYVLSDTDEWKCYKMKHTISCFSLYPNGDINVNMLPTMEGNEYFENKNADKIGKARVYAYWNYLQKEKGMKGYKIVKIYDAGIREGYRLIGKYVLTENDIINQKSGTNNNIIAAIADHALDVHGSDGMCKELEFPYEIPLECTMTVEYTNLFVASRGASFSHIASSSTRLSRTILSIGESVGEYISQLISEKITAEK